ncbi:MAG: hypothetical protein P1V36_11865 [Planctomycetota bacterium]|nr:hypothetical protein [Planctomycetota bacterium]
MLWLVIGGVLLGLVVVVYIVSASTHQESSTSGRDGEPGHARSARYRNRGSKGRKDNST